MNENLIKLFSAWCQEKPNKITPLPISGSSRKYYRIRSDKVSAIGVENSDHKENVAYIEFSKHFLKNRLNVPRIWEVDYDNDTYLVEDLGDKTLYSELEKFRIDNQFPEKMIGYYEKILDILPDFQIGSVKDFPFRYCYPRSEFDAQSMRWDLSYFKYYFLKLAGIEFDEQALEDDFHKFTEYLLTAQADYFMYRDFQSRNIMIRDEELFFIDFQGGRKGALQYDVASLLYDAKADIPENVRENLLNRYIENLKSYTKVDKDTFVGLYYGFVLIRILQAMGAYGFRGFYEKKAHFLASIPLALNNLKNLLPKLNLPFDMPELLTALNKLSQSAKLYELGETRKKLNIHINSFSYKRGIPVDETGNGGGFVFDCRALNNPGRYEKYKKLTGKDLEVIEYLENEKNVKTFKEHISSIADMSVKNYIQREFTDLMINFGCTGGQHRSVYMAEYLNDYLKNKYNVNIKLRHREMEMKNL